MGLLKSVGKVAKGALDIVAPTIASALPGPLGKMAKAAVTAALGLDKEANEAEIEKALAVANPEILAKVKQAELDFQAKMKQLDVDVERLLAEDRASARARHIAFTASDSRDSRQTARARQQGNRALPG